MACFWLFSKTPFVGPFLSKLAFLAFAYRVKAWKERTYNGGGTLGGEGAVGTAGLKRVRCKRSGDRTYSGENFKPNPPSADKPTTKNIENPRHRCSTQAWRTYVHMLGKTHHQVGIHTSIEKFSLTRCRPLVPMVAPSNGSRARLTMAEPNASGVGEHRNPVPPCTTVSRGPP